MKILKDFCVHLPKHAVDQERALDWIAFMHAKSQRVEEAGHHPTKDQLRKILVKIGLGKEKIEKRYFQMSDILLHDVSQMKLYNLEKQQKGSSLQNKMQCFLDETLLVFKEFYRELKPKDHIIHVSCTGYTSPSPAQIIAAEYSDISPTVTHAYHMGCYGALPAIRIAEGFKEESDIVHTEFCSLHMNPENHTIGQLVVESLFADGFIKYTVSNKRDDQSQALQIIGMKEQVIPNSLESMTWRCADGGFSMYLSKDVPIKIAKALLPYLHSLAKKCGIDVDFLKNHAIFAIHPGGPKIIDQVKDIFSLSDFQVLHSKRVLKTRGNMSSATLPHVWGSIVSDTHVLPGTYIVSMAFGPGLTISGAIFQKLG